MKMQCNVLMMCYRGCVFRSLVYDVTLNPILKAMVFQEVLLWRKLHRYNSSFMPYLTSYQGLRIDAQTGLDYLTSHPFFQRHTYYSIVSAVSFHLDLPELHSFSQLERLYTDNQSEVRLQSTSLWLSESWAF